LRNLTQNFCFRLDALRRRIVILRNDLRAFKLGQKGHVGKTLQKIDDPDIVDVIPVDRNRSKGHKYRMPRSKKITWQTETRKVET